MENKRKSLKNRRTRLWKSVLASLLGTAVFLSAQTAYLPGILEVYAAGEQADENGFLIENGILVKYSGTEKEVVIPEGVTGIGEEAFAGCSSLKSITIPEEVTSIGAFAFKGCSSLTGINIPKSITSIGDGAFVDCSGLAGITVENGNLNYDSRGNCNAIIQKVSENRPRLIAGCKNTVIPNEEIDIGAYAFRGCTGLTSLYIPANMGFIEEGAFSGCSGLASITVDEKNGHYDSRDNCNAVIFDSSNKVSLGCKNTVIPEGIDDIGEYAFAGCSDLTSLNNIEGIEQINRIMQYAFAGCTSLTSLDIPESVDILAEGAFRGCTSLTSVHIPGDVTSIAPYTFAGCTSLIRVNISIGKLRDISNGAFSGCSSLTSINIPASITHLLQGAFTGCDKLTIYGEKGTLAETYATENNIAFHGTEDFLIEYPGLNNKEINLIKYTGTEKEVEIPEGVQNIMGNAFIDCSSITGIKIPDSVKAIKESAFSGCANLTRIYIPEGVSNIERSAFSGCSSLISINLPDIYYIPINIFSGCSNLTDIYIPSGIGSLPNNAFTDCDKLTIYGEKNSYAETYAGKYNIPFHAVREPLDKNGFLIEDGVLVKYFGTEKEVVIPEGVTNIGDGVFSGCGSMMSINIPASVTNIGANAFNGCSSLTSIHVPEGVTAIGTDAFAGCDALTIYCEKGSYAETYAKENVLPFYAIGEDAADENGFFIENGVLVKYTGTDEVVAVPEGITCIGNEAFSGCSSITGIKIPASVTGIGNSAFKGCSSLISLNIPGSVTDIGNYAFRDCSSLMNMNIPASVTGIGINAFAGCDKLIIYGEKASYTETYAAKNNIPFYAAEEPADENGFFIENGVLVKYSGIDKEIKVPEGVTGIGASVFRDCGSVTGIYIPEGVSSIGADAFNGCSGLTDIDLPVSITDIGNGAFKGCSSLTGMHIPAGVTSIGTDTFNGCTSLTSINIPAGVTSIGVNAFAGCDALTIYGEQGSYAETYAGINNIPFFTTGKPADENGFLIEDGVLVKYFGTDKEIVISEGVTSIGDEAFKDCRNLTRIDIPEEITSIGTDAFAGCDKLTIYGEKGSYAETYAKANNIPFCPFQTKNPDILSLEEMGQLIEANKTQDTIIQTVTGIIYTFKKGTMELPEVRDSYDFGAEITEDYAALPNTVFTEEEFAFRVDYNYEGLLPGEAEISIPAGEKWAGKRLYYYEILEDGTYKYVCRSTVTEDGTYTVKQNRCSSYTAVAKAPENLGDADGQGGVTSDDALAILKYAVGIPQEGFAAELADCDGVDGVTTDDALAVLRYIVGIIDELK